MKRKLQTIALTVMTMLLWPVGVWGQETEVSTWEELKTAMAAGGNIKLTADCIDPDKTSSSYLNVPDGKTVILDLNSFTIDHGLTDDTDNGSVIINGGTLTITDNSSAKTGAIKGGWTKDHVTISGAGIKNTGTLTIQGGTITGNRAGYYGHGSAIYNSGIMTITGGSITGNGGNGYGAIYHDNSAAGSFNMSGAPVIENNSAYSYTYCKNILLKQGVITIIGELTNTTKYGVGNIESMEEYSDSPGFITSGFGTYNSDDVLDYFTTEATGCKIVKDGTDAKFEYTEWQTLNNTIKNAANNTTITLTQNYTGIETDTYLKVPSGKTITLNLNGKTLDRHSSNAIYYGFAIKNLGTLTITGNGTITGGYCSSTGTGGAGGVFNDGTLTLENVTVTGNKTNSSYYGGGVYNTYNKTLNLNGGVVITGNYLSNGSSNNLYPSSSTINITGDLGSSSIGIYKISSGVFTSGLDGHGTLANFSLDTNGLLELEGGEAKYTVSDFMPQNNTLTEVGTAANPWLIRNASDLSTLYYKVYSGNTYSDTYFKVNNDITAADNTQIGSSSYAFSGIFDGNNKTITLNNSYGGLFKEISDATIKNLTIAGSVSGSSYLGALVNESFGTCLIDNCHNTATVTATSWNIGGILGCAMNSSATTISNCSNSADIYGSNQVGGIIGYCANEVTIANCQTTGTATITVSSSSNNVGAIVGIIDGSPTLSGNTYSTGVTVTRGTNNYTAQNHALGIGAGIATTPQDVEGITFMPAYTFSGIGDLTHGAITATYGDGTANVTKAPDGATITLSSSSAGGYTLGGITVNNGAVAVTDNHDGTYSFTMPDANAAVVANWNYTSGSTTITDNGTTVTAAIDESTEAGGVVPADVTTASLTYTRDIPAGTDAYTVCLPYAPPTSADIKYYTLSGVSGTTLNFSEVATPAANTPYLVVATAATSVGTTSVAVDFSAAVSNPSEVAGGYQLKGTLKGLNHAASEGMYILQSGNKWGVVDDDHMTVYIPPFRAYIESTGAGARSLDSNFGDGATGISRLHTIDADGTEQWFDLNGRRISKPTQHGIYIHNGRKEVVK